MADYVVNNSVTTTQVLSTTESVPVQRFSITTEPHGVRLYVNVPYKEYTAGHEATYLEPPASIVEGLFAEGLVTDANYAQDADASRLLAGYVDFTVSYTGPTSQGLPSEAVVRIPMTALETRAAYTAYASTPPHDKPIVTAYNRLVESSGGPASDMV